MIAKTISIDWSKAVDIEIGELTPRMKELVKEAAGITQSLNCLPT